MGMSLDTRSGGPVADPNVVPLIDVLLVLIIIFMVITPKMPTGLPAVIPQPAPPATNSVVPPPTDVVVQVTESGDVMINEEKSDWDSLGDRLAAIFKGRADKVAFVKGGGDVPFEQVARCIDIMRGAGIDQIGLFTGSSNASKQSL